MKIPVQYVPARIMRMARGRELTEKEVYAAAMFCYFEEHNWLLRSGMSTNFPRGYKVQNSAKNFGMKPGKSQARPEGYDVLRWALIDGLSFAQIAMRCGWKTSPRTMHRAGKRLLRDYLVLFARQLTDVAIVA